MQNYFIVMIIFFEVNSRFKIIKLNTVGHEYNLCDLINCEPDPDFEILSNKDSQKKGQYNKVLTTIRESKDYSAWYFTTQNEKNYIETLFFFKSETFQNGEFVLELRTFEDFLNHLVFDKFHELEYFKWSENPRLSIIYSYSLCYHNADVFNSCPNPCNRLPCRIKHAKELSCQKYIDSNYNPLIDRHLKNTKNFADMFRQRFDCTCEEGYIYEKDKNICKPDPSICEDKEDKPCYNGAHCNYNGTNEDQIYSCMRIAAFIPRFRINFYFYSFR